MPITVTIGAAFANPAPPLTTAQTKDANAAISGLLLTDVWRGKKTISTSGAMRVDCQGLDANGRANLQVQINTESGHTTAATVLVDKSVGEITMPAQQIYAINKIKGALIDSLRSRNIYTIAGNPI